MSITQTAVQVTSGSCGDFVIANNKPLTLIAGPCQLESRDHAMFMAEAILSVASKLRINFIFKTSFDKANRASVNSKRGVGLDAAMMIFDDIRCNIGCPIVTDIHEAYQADIVAGHVDVIQIPALLCRQTDLLLSAAKTGKIVNVKKGQFLSPYDMLNVIEKVKSCGNDSILLTERGTSFGYNTLVNDMRGLQIMRDMGYPVVFDATHSVQQPGYLGTSSGGQKQFIGCLTRAAVAVGVAGIFIETHNAPDTAPCDGQCMLPLADLEQLLIQVMEIDAIVKK